MSLDGRVAIVTGASRGIGFAAAQALADEGVRILAAARTAEGLDELAASGATAVGLDWTVDLAEARRRVGARVALQGNLDPLVLLTDPETVRREAAAVVRAAGPAAGHVFNLGHGILPETPPEHVAVLVDTVHSESRAIRAAA